MGWFYRNQILFIEPSYIILGNEQIILNLNNEEEDKKIEGIPFTDENKEMDYQRQSCYKNLNKNSFICLDNYLKQFNIINENKVKLFGIREDIKGQFFEIKDKLLFILNKKQLLIYEFNN